MDYIKLLQQQVNMWQGQQKCGLCWSFNAPLQDSGVNKSTQREEACCVHVFVTDMNVREVRNYNTSTGFLSQKYDEVSLTIEFLKKSELGDNVYREQDYPLDQSKWDSILSPIKECLDSDAPFDFCTITNRNLKIISRNWKVIVNNIHAENYVGWRVSLTLRDDDPSLDTIHPIVVVNAIDEPSNTPFDGAITLTGNGIAGTTHVVQISNGYGYFLNIGNDSAFTTSDVNTITSIIAGVESEQPFSPNSYNELNLLVNKPPVTTEIDSATLQVVNDMAYLSLDYMYPEAGSPYFVIEIQGSNTGDFTDAVLVHSYVEDSNDKNFVNSYNAYRARLKRITDDSAGPYTIVQGTNTHEITLKPISLNTICNLGTCTLFWNHLGGRGSFVVQASTDNFNLESNMTVISEDALSGTQLAQGAYNQWRVRFVGETGLPSAFTYDTF